MAGVVVSASSLPDAAAQTKKKKPSAKDREAARESYNAGTDAFGKADYTAALAHFEKANTIIPAPQAQYWIAQSLDKLNRKEEAIVAYERLLADENVSKIGEEKMATAKARIAALQAPEPPKEETPPPEPPKEEAPPPEPVVETPPPAPEPAPPPADDDLSAKGNLVELGLMTGPIFLSGSHNLREDRFPVADYSSLSWLLGLRAAYFPAAFFGIEAEYAHGWGSVDGTSSGLSSGSDSAQFNTVRGHLIGQLPVSRFTPFLLLGAGVLQATSDRMGDDGDFMLEAGLGAKFAATEVLTPRLDLRLDMTQKEGGGFGDGIAVHPEILLGLSATLGR